MSEPKMCMPVEQCRELLVELQQLRLRLTTLEQAVASAVNDIEPPDQAPTGPTR